MIAEHHVYSPQSSIVSRDKLAKVLNKCGWEIAFAAEGVTGAADDCGPLGNDQVLGWRGDDSDNLKIRRAAKMNDKNALDGYIKSKRLACCKIQVTHCSDVLERGAIDKVRRKYGTGGVDALRNANLSYHLRSADAQSPCSICFQSIAWLAVAQLSHGVGLYPQTGDDCFGPTITQEHYAKLEEAYRLSRNPLSAFLRALVGKLGKHGTPGR